MTRILSVVRNTEDGPEKFCTVCHDWWPADGEFFPTEIRRGHPRLMNRCHACNAERKARQWQAKKQRLSAT